MKKNKISDKILGYIICFNPISKEIRLDFMKESLKLIDVNEIKRLQQRYNFQARNINRKASIPNEIKNDVKKFIEIMSFNFSEENLKNLYSNLKWVKIVLRKQNDITLDEGYYDAKKNKIKLIELDKLYSMLFQLSANDSKIDNSSYGFYYETDEFSIGEALSRGYSELLAERYFGTNDKNYIYEKRFARALEIIVGKNKFQKMYFSSNLFSLIKYLKHYYTTQEIITFIRATDLIFDYSSFYYISNDELKIVNKQLQYIVEFLIKGYCIKLSKLNYTEEKNNQLIKQYLDYINVSIKYSYNKKTKLNIERINKLINSYLVNKTSSSVLQKKKNML